MNTVAMLAPTLALSRMRGREWEVVLRADKVIE